MLPNFLECWWDHLLLDLLGANLLGMLAGWAVIIIYDIKRFHWVKDSNDRFVLFDSNKRYWLIILYCAFMLAVDCNNFFLKAVLWVEESSEMLKFRVAVWGFMGLAATAEYNELIEGR